MNNKVRAMAEAYWDEAVPEVVALPALAKAVDRKELVKSLKAQAAPMKKGQRQASFLLHMLEIGGGLTKAQWDQAKAVISGTHKVRKGYLGRIPGFLFRVKNTDDVSAEFPSWWGECFDQLPCPAGWADSERVLFQVKPKKGLLTLVSHSRRKMVLSFRFTTHVKGSKPVSHSYTLVVLRDARWGDFITVCNSKGNVNEN